jgi:MFS family permease
MVAEMVPEKILQPKAFSLMPLVWSIGSVFGPAFGGFFARPVEHFPGLFGDSVFFKKYPFALPNIMACCVFFISAMTGLLFLKVSETLPFCPMLSGYTDFDRKHLKANVTTETGA